MDIDPRSNGALMSALLATFAAVSCASSSTARTEALRDHVATQHRELAAGSSDGIAPGGVVLVADGDEILLQFAFGYADVDRRVPMSVDTALPVGSISKSFTAAAILTLVDRGVLSLDDDIRDHCDYPTDGRTVTIEQVLTHTSGLPNLVDDNEFEVWMREAHTTSTLLARTHDVPFHFEPGEGYRYSDTGYMILAAIVEEVTGDDFGTALANLVTERVGLPATSMMSDRPVEAVGYTYEDGRLGEPAFMHPTIPHGAGGVVSSADDLRRWVRAFANGDVVSAPLAARAWTGRDLPYGRRSGYGFGWKRFRFEGRPAVGHGGWVYGFTASLMHLPNDDLTVIALVNNDASRPEASYLARQCARLVLTGTAEVPTVSLAPSDAQRLVGEYRTPSGATVRVVAGADGLAWQWGEGELERLDALSPSVLAVAGSDATYCLEFDLEEAGPATGFRTTLTSEPVDVARRVDSARAPRAH